jgi:hypothetical protein
MGFHLSVWRFDMAYIATSVKGEWGIRKINRSLIEQKWNNQTALCPII